ncbi:YybH family protein [Melissospora conviva]|uniref:YybH family protein n=1 Tax=Melissospora conviva TaxID=3388432 RepID=UPI003C19F1D2
MTTFDETVAAHLDAVARRDLAAYLDTVHDEATVVLPNGTVLSGRDEVAAFHKEWFDDPDWRMDLTALRSYTVGATGVAVYQVEYHDVDGSGKPYQKAYVLSLAFTRHDDRWLLVHDQNTFC